MALKTVVKSLDDVDATLHSFYKETKIKVGTTEETWFVLDLEGVDEHPSVKALKNALDRQKEERRKAVEDLDKLKARIEKIPEDFDPEKYEALLHELEELKKDPKNRTTPDAQQAAEQAQARKQLEQRIARMEKDHATALAKKDEELKKRTAKINELLIDDGLTKALIEAGVGKEFLKATKAMLRMQCEVIEEDGDYRAVVKSDLGDTEIARYVTDWVASDEGKAFVPPAKGGDANNNSGRPTKTDAAVANPWHKDHWNLTEQGKILRADRAKAEKLAKAAGKTLPPAAA